MKQFEQRLKKLEELVEKLREGTVPLSDAVSMFEEGIQLAKSLEKDLNTIEKKIEVLVNEPGKTGDEPTLELFPELKDHQE